jgi:hypothetical protein
MKYLQPSLLLALVLGTAFVLPAQAEEHKHKHHHKAEKAPEKAPEVAPAKGPEKDERGHVVTAEAKAARLADCRAALTADAAFQPAMPKGFENTLPGQWAIKNIALNKERLSKGLSGKPFGGMTDPQSICEQSKRNVTDVKKQYEFDVKIYSATGQ